MNRIEQLIQQNNINCESALGRGKTSSGVLSDLRSQPSNPEMVFTMEQLELLKKIGIKKESATGK